MDRHAAALPQLPYWVSGEFQRIRVNIVMQKTIERLQRQDTRVLQEDTQRTKPTQGVAGTPIRRKEQQDPAVHGDRAGSGAGSCAYKWLMLVVCAMALYGGYAGTKDVRRLASSMHTWAATDLPITPPAPPLLSAPPPPPGKSANLWVAAHCLLFCHFFGMASKFCGESLR